MMLPFPADSAEYDEYVSVMEAMADEADKLPDPEPKDFRFENFGYLENRICDYVEINLPSAKHLAK